MICDPEGSHVEIQLVVSGNGDAKFSAQPPASLRPFSKRVKKTSFPPYVPLSKARLIMPIVTELQEACLVPILTKVRKDGVTSWHSAPLLLQHLGNIIAFE